jgi:hypothetical protein
MTIGANAPDFRTFRKFAEGSQAVNSKEVTTQNCAILQPKTAKMMNVSERQVDKAAKLRSPLSNTGFAR